MLGIAARRLDIECVFLDPAPSPPAASVGPVLDSPFDDEETLARLASDVDVISYEFENVPVAALQSLADTTPVYPPLAALSEAQDRVNEKRLFEALEVALPRWAAIDSEQDLHNAIKDIGLPLVLKTRRFGYDGKGQYVLRKASDAEHALSQLPPRPLIAEQFVAFDREVSAIAARRRNGDIVHYPLTENVHRGGILRTSSAPAGPASLTDAAQEYIERLLQHLDYVGVLALEFFVVDDRLLANEFAPRVHNSGHWTIEGTETSQFENHIRAILDLPLGSTLATGHAGMVNLIGAMPASPDSLISTKMHLHDYGKAPRDGRKLGHLTFVEQDPASRDRQLARMDAMLGG